MSSDQLFYDHHIFVCTNQRRDGHPRGCCADKGSVDLRDALKKRAKELGIRKLRVNSAGCLDRCELGPTLVLYPEGVWYTYDSLADLEEILISHVQQGKKVDRLLLQVNQVERQNPERRQQ